MDQMIIWNCVDNYFIVSACLIINTIPDSQFFVDSTVCDGFITVYKIYTVIYNH